MTSRKLFACAAAAAVLASGVLAAPGSAGPSPRRAAPSPNPVRGDLAALRGAVEVVPREIVVELKAGVTRAGASRAAQAAGARLAATVPRARVALVKVPSTARLDSVLAELTSDPRVAHAEPNLLRFIAQQPQGPNDELFPQMWGLDNEGQLHDTADFDGVQNSSGEQRAGTQDADIDAPEAWEMTRGDPESVIAVVDTGVDVSHPDLGPNIWVNDGEIPDNGVDDDGNGFVDDVNGWDFGDRDNTLFEPNPSVLGFDHGTHVAGTIAAEDGNRIGTVGVCPDCRVMVLKVARPVRVGGGQSEMGIDLFAEIEALDYARREGADIINASFGGPFVWSKLEWRAFKRLGQAGVLAVIAAGNFRSTNDSLFFDDFEQDGFPEWASPIFPASYNLPNTVAVAASTDRDEYGISSDCPADSPLCFFTNWGNESVDIAAPGTDVVSTVPGPDYAFWDGTSMAAPHVAGVAGLVQSAFPQLGAFGLKQQLLTSADQKPSFESAPAFPREIVRGRLTVTSGRVNARRALNEPVRVASPPPSDGNIDGARRIRQKRWGRVDWPDDVNDVYLKWLRKGRRYRVALRSRDGADLDLFVWKRRTKEVWALQEGCFVSPPRGCKLLSDEGATSNADESVTFRAPKTGRHYFHVNAFVFNAGRYVLKVTRL